MSRNIRLFPTFSAKENHTTNHCLLILKMLYEENPKFLSESLSLLLGDSFAGSVGVQFVQQRKLRLVNSIPDGEITQEAFSIVIETKLADNFGKIQLLKHLEGGCDLYMIQLDGNRKAILIEIAPELFPTSVCQN